MLLADQIRIMRQKMFLSQEAFASELNVSLATVYRWETGKSKPNLSAMRNIKAFCINHDIDYLPIEESWLVLDRHSELSNSGGEKNVITE